MKGRKDSESTPSGVLVLAGPDAHVVRASFSSALPDLKALVEVKGSDWALMQDRVPLEFGAVLILKDAEYDFMRRLLKNATDKRILYKNFNLDSAIAWVAKRFGRVVTKPLSNIPSTNGSNGHKSSSNPPRRKTLALRYKLFNAEAEEIPSEYFSVWDDCYGSTPAEDLFQKYKEPYLLDQIAEKRRLKVL